MSRPGSPGGGAVRGAAAVAAGLAVAVALTGCSLGGRSERKAAREAANKATAAALQKRLAQLAGVTSADVGYIDVFGHSGAARATLEVARGTDLEALADQVVGELWRATFEPLHTIRVAVGFRLDDGRPVVAERFYTTPRDEALLRARYGPRPAPAQ